MPVIGTNTSANTALRYLNENSSNQQGYLSKLASGSRIERASDDAGGLGVATRLSSDVTTLEQNAINAQHGQAVAQTADGALSRIADILQRMKALATQAVSGAVDSTSRGFLNTEFTALRDDIDAIVDSTRFNGTTLIDGSYSGQAFLVGTDGSTAAASTDRISVTFGDVSTGSGGLNIGSLQINTEANASTALAAGSGALDAAIDTVSTQRSTAGAAISRLEFRADVIATSLDNLSAAKSVLMDADIAATQTKFTNAETLTEAAIAALGKANEMPQELLRLLQ